MSDELHEYEFTGTFEVRGTYKVTAASRQEAREIAEGARIWLWDLDTTEGAGTSVASDYPGDLELQAIDGYDPDETCAWCDGKAVVHCEICDQPACRNHGHSDGESGERCHEHPFEELED